jgi:flavodoxin
MKTSPILVVYYSRSGVTRALATALRSDLHCDIERITDTAQREGPIGHLRSIFDALLDRPADILPMRSPICEYELVIVGGPVWNGAIATPVRAFLEQYRNVLPRVAFFCTYVHTGSARALRGLEEYAGQPPLVTLDIRQEDLGSHAVSFKLRTFAATANAFAPSPLRPSRPPLPLAMPLPVTSA